MQKLRDVRKQLDVRLDDLREATRFMDREQTAAWDALSTERKQRLIREVRGGGYRGFAMSAGKSAVQVAATHKKDAAINPESGNVGQAGPPGRLYKIQRQYKYLWLRVKMCPQKKGKRKILGRRDRSARRTWQLDESNRFRRWKKKQIFMQKNPVEERQLQ